MARLIFCFFAEDTDIFNGDDLHAALDEAADNPCKLLNLRKRMSNIRVFDPACGSGNFLVIAYKEMRAVEVQINIRRGAANRETDIP